MTFDTVVMVDWSGGNAKGPRPCADAIWCCTAKAGVVDTPLYFQSRQAVEPWLANLVENTLTAGRRLMLGFDFSFGLPAPAAQTITGTGDPLAFWTWLEERIEDAPQANNRFDVAAGMNRRFGGLGPFWGNGLSRDIADLPRKGRARQGHGMPERRAVEARARGAFSVWQLAGAGAVGSQMLMGLPVLERLRRRFAGQVAIWPFEAQDRPVTIVEIWPSLYKARMCGYDGWIKDAAQVHMMAGLATTMPERELSRALAAPPTSEGWIFGVGP